MSSPLRIAHRGMPTLATENTLRSFELALEYGAQGIELDVHATSDGMIVVHHDANLPSGTELQRTRLENLLAEMPDLPTLDEVTELVNGRAQLFVEVKGVAIEGRVEVALSRYTGSAAIHSFDHELILRLARSGTKRRLGILIESDGNDALMAMTRTGAVDLWPHHSLVTSRMVDAVHAFGGRVIPWTVNTEPEILRLAAFAVDGICTDDVRILPS
ncbi:MAG: glycerophosphodiester phosphodiesterase [Gemmatimonadota bacterium]|nr:glycerophosphodiester phosphodiesterase [Gemmatimonadota bacterium]